MTTKTIKTNPLKTMSLDGVLAPLPAKDRFRSGKATHGIRLAGFNADLREIDPATPGATVLFAFIFGTVSDCIIPVATDGEGWVPFSWKDVPLPGWCRGNEHTPWWKCDTDRYGFEAARLVLQPHRHDLYAPPKVARVHGIIEAHAKDLGLDAT